MEKSNEIPRVKYLRKKKIFSWFLWLTLGFLVGLVFISSFGDGQSFGREMSIAFLISACWCAYCIKSNVGLPVDFQKQIDEAIKCNNCKN